MDAATVGTAPREAPRARNPVDRKRIRRLRIVACVVALFVSVTTLAALLTWQRMLDAAAQRLPELPKVVREVYKQPTKIVANDGTVLYSITAEYRKPLPLEKIPNYVINATLAAEDKRFFQHDGVDELAIMRVFWSTAREGRNTQGGSTLTMQIAKRMFTSNDRTIERKLKDMALATMIERTWTKQQILEFYLNEVFYGSGAYGIAAAAYVYFRKSVDQLTIAEAALLARCVRRPSQENPFVNLDGALANRDMVLGIMLDEHMITSAQYSEALLEKPKLAERPKDLLVGKKIAPYFVDWVFAETQRLLPHSDISRGGYRIETTLDPKIQSITEAQVRRTVERYRRSRITTAAFVLMDRDGKVLSMVGGVDYNRNQFNVVTQGKRQPGSSFKPFVYGAALEYGVLSPYSSISNAPFVVRDGGHTWAPKGGGRGGSMSVAAAIRNSVNVPAVRTIDMVGPSNVVHLAKTAFGFSADLKPYLSLALGACEVSPLEMAQAYSVFQHGGDRVKPFGILRVLGPDGRVIREFAPEVTRQVVRSRTANDMDMMLRGVVVGGTGKAASSVVNARGKTGTTDDHKDAWFCGYTDTLVGIGWVADEIPVSKQGGRLRWKYGSMAGVFGGHAVAPMWAAIVKPSQALIGESKRYVRAASGGSVSSSSEGAPKKQATVPVYEPEPEPAPGEDEPMPPTMEPPPPQPDEDAGLDGGPVAYLEICPDSGRLATAYCPERVLKPYRIGRGPSRSCTLHKASN